MSHTAGSKCPSTVHTCASSHGLLRQVGAGQSGGVHARRSRVQEQDWFQGSAVAGAQAAGKRTNSLLLMRLSLTVLQQVVKLGVVQIGIPRRNEAFLSRLFCCSAVACLSVLHKHTRSFAAANIRVCRQEPTKHQYDWDAATTMNFLRTYGLQDEFKLNIECNHATLAGHSCDHELQARPRFLHYAA